MTDALNPCLTSKNHKIKMNAKSSEKSSVSDEQAEDLPEETPEKNMDEDQESVKRENTEEEEPTAQEMNVMQLRKTSQQRSTYTFRAERRAARGSRGKTKGVKRKRNLSSRGRKKPNSGYDASGWEEQSVSESDDSNSVNEYPTESQTIPTVEKFLYNPGVPWPDLSPYLQQVVEVRVSKEFITPTNKQVAQRMLWGNEVYTSDSDIVAVMHHLGLINIWDPNLGPYEGVAVIVRVAKGRNNYTGCVKNGIKSRKLVNYKGHSIKPEKIIKLSTIGKLDELVVMAEKMPTEYPKVRNKPELNPRAMRIIPGTLLVFNLSCEVATPYTLDNFGDKGWDENEFVSAKLKKFTLYVETAHERYELSMASEEDEEQIFEHQDKFRWVKVKKPLLNKDYEFMTTKKVPLEDQWIEVLNKSLDWSDIEWSSHSTFIKNVEYGPLVCFKYIPNKG